MSNALLIALRWFKNHKRYLFILLLCLAFFCIGAVMCSCKSTRTYSVTRVYTSTNTPPKSVIINQGGKQMLWVPAHSLQ